MDNHELTRVYDELKTLRASIEALRDTILDDHNSLREKVHAMEVQLAEQRTTIDNIKNENRERRLKDILGTIGTSGVVAGGAVAAQYFLGK